MQEEYIRLTDANGADVVGVIQRYGSGNRSGEEILASLRRIEEKLSADFSGTPGVLVAEMKGLPFALTHARAIIAQTQRMIGLGLITKVVYVASRDMVLSNISALFQRFAAMSVDIRHEDDVESALDAIKAGEY